MCGGQSLFEIVAHCAGKSEGVRVGIIMGSDSDLATMRGAAEVLKSMGIQAEVTIVSAHRTPDRMLEYARSAHKRGIQVPLLLTPQEVLSEEALYI